MFETETVLIDFFVVGTLHGVRPENSATWTAVQWKDWAQRELRKRREGDGFTEVTDSCWNQFSEEEPPAIGGVITEEEGQVLQTYLHRAYFAQDALEIV